MPGATSRLGVVALAGALITGCTAGDPDTVRTDGTLVVGASLELTGSGAPAGIAAGNALELALEQINAAGVTVGGRTLAVRLVVRDNRSDAGTARTQARALVEDDEAAVLIGGGQLETAGAIAKIAESERVPLLALAAENSLVRPATEHRYVFKLPANADDVAALLADRLRHDGRRSVAVLAAAGTHGDEGADAMSAALTAAGIPAAPVVRFTPDGPGLTDAARQVTGSRPAATVIWSDVPAAGRAAVALRQNGFAGQLAFDPAAGGSETLAAANLPAIENSLLVHPPVFDMEGLDPNDPLNLAPRRFVERYTHRYGSFSGLAPYASDALDLVVSAATRAGSPTPGRLRDALETTRHDGIAGSYSFSPTNHGGLAVDRLVIFRCRQGRWVRSS